MLVFSLKIFYYTDLLNCRVWEAQPYREISLGRLWPDFIWERKLPHTWENCPSPEALIPGQENLMDGKQISFRSGWPSELWFPV